MKTITQTKQFQIELSGAIAKKAAGMLRDDVVRITDTNRTDISRIVNLHTDDFGLQKIINIANKLGITVSFSIHEDSGPETKLKSHVNLDVVNS